MPKLLLLISSKQEPKGPIPAGAGKQLRSDLQWAETAREVSGGLLASDVAAQLALGVRAHKVYDGCLCVAGFRAL